MLGHQTACCYGGDADPSVPGGITAIYCDLVADDRRTRQVTADVAAALARGRNCQVLTELDRAPAETGWHAGIPLLEQARRTATTAAGLVSSDPYSAYVLAYDAARFACIALLAQQGLRATTSGGHYAVEQSARAQLRQL